MSGVSLDHSSMLLISGSKTNKGELGAIEFEFEPILDIEDIDSLSELEPAIEIDSMSFEFYPINAMFSLFF